MSSMFIAPCTWHVETKQFDRINSKWVAYILEYQNNVSFTIHTAIELLSKSIGSFLNSTWIQCVLNVNNQKRATKLCPVLLNCERHIVKCTQPQLKCISSWCIYFWSFKNTLQYTDLAGDFYRLIFVCFREFFFSLSFFLKNLTEQLKHMMINWNWYWKRMLRHF